MDGTIEHINGVPHVRFEDVCTFEPTRMIRWWPLPSARDLVEDGDRVEYLGNGVERIRGNWGPCLSYRDFFLPQGGDTKAARTQAVPIPPPKTKLETRWNNGRWERLTARGWRA
jgi:hypothetical protein